MQREFTGEPTVKVQASGECRDARRWAYSAADGDAGHVLHVMQHQPSRLLRPWSHRAAPPPAELVWPNRSSIVMAVAFATRPARCEFDAAAGTLLSEDGGSGRACASCEPGHDVGAWPVAMNSIMAFLAQPVGSSPDGRVPRVWNPEQPHVTVALGECEVLFVGGAQVILACENQRGGCRDARWRGRRGRGRRPIHAQANRGAGNRRCRGKRRRGGGG